MREIKMLIEQKVIYSFYPGVSLPGNHALPLFFRRRGPNRW